MISLSCPICKEKLSIFQKSYICENKHSFDISKEGYANFHLQSKGDKSPSGDSKEMVSARQSFLNKGYYDSLKNVLCKLAANYSAENSQIVDCGCGEGYYTASIGDYLSEKNQKILGFDISKTAIKQAAKRTKNTLLFVANVFELPLFNESTDIIFSIFAPLAIEEFGRILKKDGYLIIVSPDKEHLFELKTLLYDKPYYNEQSDTELEGFALVENIAVNNMIEINSNEDINNLFLMTPYYWKTGIKSFHKLKELTFLKTTTAFNIRIYRKG
jgi:23S rRNA (guanine745-N1)-methyltransferase